MIPNVHLLGIQGSGKGTQSALLVKKYSATYLASGNIFRERASIKDAEGIRIASLMRGGNLLPNKLLVDTVQGALAANPPTSMLLCDGVIRTLEQLRLLQPVWAEHSVDEPVLIYLELDEGTARERVAKREAERHIPEKREYHAVFSGKLVQREDDNPQALEERFRLFRNMTEPIVSAFQARKRCMTIPANQPVEAVHAEVCAAIATFYPTAR